MGLIIKGTIPRVPPFSPWKTTQPVLVQTCPIFTAHFLPPKHFQRQDAWPGGGWWMDWWIWRAKSLKLGGGSFPFKWHPAPQKSTMVGKICCFGSKEFSFQLNFQLPGFWCVMLVLLGVFVRGYCFLLGKNNLVQNCVPFCMWITEWWRWFWIKALSL